MFRAIFAAILLLVGCGSGEAKVTRGSAPTFTPAWQPLSLGGGGNIQIIRASADGTIVANTDTNGGYIFNSTGGCTVGGRTYASPCWRPLVTSVSTPSGSVTIPIAESGNVATMDIASCDSTSGSSKVLYMMWHNAVYVSTNRGASWTLTPAIYSNNPAGGPLQLSWIACDPNNANIVYFQTPSSGVFKTANGLSGASSTWAQVSTSQIPAAGGNGGSIAYDPTSSPVGGVTQHFVISSSGTGHGVYETSNGGTSFTKISGSSTNIVQMAFDKFGQLWATDSFKGSSNTYYKYASGTWASGTIRAGNYIVSLIFDPKTGGSVGGNQVIAGDGSGRLYATLNNGSSWVQVASTPTISASSPQPVWLGSAAYGSGFNLNVNSYAIDPSGNVYAATGVDAFSTPDPITGGVVGTTTTWSPNTVGIEQLVTNQIIAPPGNSPLTCVWDRGCFFDKNPDVFPSVQYPNSTRINVIQGGWGIDWAAPNQNFLTALIASNLDSTSGSASSSDGGNAWTPWPSNPTGLGEGGVVAASSSTNWISVPGDSSAGHGAIYFTTNAATRWTQSTVPGNPSFISLNIGHVNNRQPIAADRVTAGKFYAVDQNQNFYVSTNNGASFSLTGGTSASVDGFVQADRIITVPGRANNVFYAPQGNSAAHLWKSTDGAAHFAKVPFSGALTQIFGFGFGAPLPGGSGYPTIYAFGKISNAQAIYESTDGGATWAAANVPSSQKNWPLNHIDGFVWVSGDMNVYGRVYVGFQGSGGTYIDTQDACPWVNFSNTNPNASLTGTVTLQAQHSGLVPVSSVQFLVDGTLIGTQTAGSGTPTTYSQSWNTSGVAHGSHTLTVTTTGNCSGGSGSFSIPITTSMLMPRDLIPTAANDNDPMWLEKAA